MTNFHTKLIMDSGKEYIIKKHPEEVIVSFQNNLGVMINGFKHFSGFSVNPSHISSIEHIKVEEE